jgi:hypothetical protein
MAKEVIEIVVKTDLGDFNKDLKKTNVEIVSVKDNVEGTEKAVEDLGKSAKASKGGLKSMAGGLKGIGTALKSLGIIGVIAAAFTALKEALGRNQKVMDAVSTVMTTISTTFNQLVDVLVDTYNWVTSSTKNFDAMGKVLKGIITIAITPMKLAFDGLKLGVQQLMLGFYKLKDAIPGNDESKNIKKMEKAIKETQKSLKDTAKEAKQAGQDIINNAAEAITEVGNIANHVVDGVSKISIKANAEAAKSQTQAINNAKLAEVALQGLVEKNDLLAEKQRQIRDDETKTFAERIEANEELGRILDKQEKDMLALADQRVKAAQMELANNKDNIDAQVALQQAINDRAGVEAQIAGFRSEQLTNQVALEKELAQVKKDLAAEELDGMGQELLELENSYNEKLDMARKAGEDTKLITEQYLKDIADIEQRYHDESVKAQEEADKAKQAEIDKEKAEAKELADYKIDLLKQGLGVLLQTLDTQLQAVDEEHQQEVKLAEAQGKDTTEINEKYEGKKAELAAKQKKIKIGLATIDMFTSAVAAYNQGMGVPPPAGLVLGPVAAGLAITAGMANISSIMQTDVGGGGGGGGSAPNPTSSGEAPAPQMMGGEFELGTALEPEPVKAYVVTDEMTNSQNQLSNIRRRATI